MNAKCSNCGTPTPIAAMLRDRWDDTWHCTVCPGEGWLLRTYGEAAVEDLIMLRHHVPGSLTLSELVELYPEKSGYFRPKQAA